MAWQTWNTVDGASGVRIWDLHLGQRRHEDAALAAFNLDSVYHGVSPGALGP